MFGWGRGGGGKGGSGSDELKDWYREYAMLRYEGIVLEGSDWRRCYFFLELGRLGRVVLYIYRWAFGVIRRRKGKEKGMSDWNGFFFFFEFLAS